MSEVGDRRRAVREIEAAGVPVMMEWGWAIARRAAFYAPGGPARSAATIQPQRVIVNGHIEVHISWDRRRFWLGFYELGTVRQPARSFLRRAAAEVR